MNLQSMNGLDKLGGTDSEKAMTFYSEAAKRKARKYIERMNALYGYELYTLPEGLDVPRTFGLGTFGIPMLLLSIFSLIFPLWLWIATAETGFPYFAIFGLQISFLPMQIIGYTLHLAFLFVGGKICKKFSRNHYGAARGVDLYKFILWDINFKGLIAIPFFIGVSYLIIWLFA